MELDWCILKACFLILSFAIFRVMHSGVGNMDHMAAEPHLSVESIQPYISLYMVLAKPNL